MSAEPYHADASLKGKLRRRGLRLLHRCPAAKPPPRAMVSVSFDDAPVSAFVAGAAVLESRGVRGTYFVCAGTVGETGFVGPLGTREHAVRAAGAGHEVACHTFSHLDCARADADAFAADAERNAQAFDEWDLPRPTTFAYPYGEVGTAAKRAVGRRYALGRGLHPGVVTRGADLAQAPAVGIEGFDGEAGALRWIDQAARRSAWLILFTHGVEDEVTRYGCTRSALERVVDHALMRGLDIVTVAEGARRMGADA